MTLKQAADKLGINYSTAKTIVQTFRKEKRVAKMPKRSMETKKGLKKGNFLKRFLNVCKTKCLMSIIIEAQVNFGQTRSSQLSETLITGNSLQQITAAFPRIESTEQMTLFEVEEGPCNGQISRGIFTNIESIVQKKEVFFIFDEIELENKYKNEIDYSNPVWLRAKPD